MNQHFPADPSAPGQFARFERLFLPPESVEAQIERQLKEGKKTGGLPHLTGAWPGDETLEELLAMLTK